VSVKASFSDLSLIVEPGLVMRPRPSTEALVEAAVRRLGDAPGRAADVGTGSGSTAIAVAREAPRAEIWASDVSLEALRISRRNVASYGLAGHVHLVKGDLLAPIPGPLDLVVATLPYLPEHLRPVRPEYRFDHRRRLSRRTTDLGCTGASSPTRTSGSPRPAPS
jgi:release factor glutamine methyltransferase